MGSGAISGYYISFNIRRWTSVCEVLTSFCFFIKFLRLSNALNSQLFLLAELDHPSRIRSTPLFLLLPSRIINSMTISEGCPDPSPGPNTKRSVSCIRSLIGMKTLQNFESDEIGGGGTKRSVERCWRRQGGCAMR